MQAGDQQTTNGSKAQRGDEQHSVIKIIEQRSVKFE